MGVINKNRNSRMKNTFIFFIFIKIIFSQTIEVELTTLSTLDDESVHIEVLSDEPKEELILPEDISSPKFLTLFYGGSITNDDLISIAIEQNDTADILYPDLNNDEDLTNDGAPIIFPLSQNSITFNIQAEEDQEQITRLKIFRKPEFPDSALSFFVDEEGNLHPHIANLFSTAQKINSFTGKARTFYFDDRLSLRKGFLNIDTTSIPIGVFDYNNNGIFSDDDDVLIIDMNRDGKLDFLHDEDIYKLSDIIRIVDKNYQLSYIDKYGKKLILEETDKEPTKYFSIWNKKISYNEAKYELDQDFWNYSFTDLLGNKVNMSNYKGKYLLLNFWGEWCAPCRKEIPDLIEAHKLYSNKLEFIGFLKTYKMDHAKEFIKENNMDWLQIELPKDIEEKFKIRGYPTNILILPDGKTFFKNGLVDIEFFGKYIQ